MAKLVGAVRLPVGKLFAAVSRRRVFLVAAAYYIVYRNWGALTDFEAGFFDWILSTVLAIGGSLIEVDKAIEEAARQLATGTVPPVTHTFDLWLVEYTFVSPTLGELAAVFAIVGAVSTLVIYFRAGKYVLESLNPNLGILEVTVGPLIIYVFAVIAASAVQGSPRVPFQGVAYLVQNFEAVVETGQMNETANVTNVSQSSAIEPVREWLVNQSSQ